MRLIILIVGLLFWVTFSKTYAQPCSGGSISPSCVTVCNGQTISLGAAGTSGTYYQWQTASSSSGPWTPIINGLGSNAVMLTGIASTTYVSVLTQPSGCPTMMSTIATVNVSQTPVVTISNVSNNSALVSWTAACGGTYNVSWSGSGGSGSQTGLTNSPAVISGLTGSCGGTMIVNVTQTNPSCPGTGVGTATASLPCGAPVLLSVVSLSSTSFKSTWSGIACAAQYRVYYRRVSTNPWLSVDTVSNTKTVSGLIPGTYQVYVVAKNCPTVGQFGMPSNKICVAVAPSTCSPVPTLTAGSNCSNNLAVDLSSNPAGSYQLRIQRTLPTLGPATTFTASASVQNITLPSNAAGTTYEVTARRACPAGAFSPWSCPQTAIINPVCSAPSNLASNWFCISGATLSWLPPSCPVTYYQMLYKKSTAINYSSVNFSAVNTISITWLTPGTYSILLRALTSCGSFTAYSENTLVTVGGPCRALDELIEDIKDNVENASVYPNPAGDFVRLNLSTAIDDDIINVELFDINGRSFSCNALVESERRLNVSWNDNVASGLYLLRVRTASNTITQRFVIQR